MAIFDGFFDNLQNGALNPKGNLADWQHAERLYVNNNFKHAPKTKYLYHVTFYLTTEAQSVIPELQQYTNAIGMLVKSADLPSFSANVETKNKYNRKKNVQTNIEYNPINIAFHDDNYGATTGLLEAYFKYYYADARQTNNFAYGDRLTGDTLYKGDNYNAFKFGMDNNTPSVPFFDRIEIAQMARRVFTKYTLVNPILTDWQHDSVDNTDSASTMENSITVQYDTVFYDRGEVQAGSDGDPTGFGSVDMYDKTPSPVSLLGGGDVGIFGIVGGVGDILGGNFDNPFQAALAGVNLVDQTQNLNSEGLRESGLNLASSALGNIASSGVGGIANTAFPKSTGTGGDSSVTEAQTSLSSTAGSSNVSQAQQNINETSSVAQQAADRRIAGLESSIETFENDAELLREQGNATAAARAEALADSRRQDLESARNQRDNIFGT